MILEEVLSLKESEDRVEFKEARSTYSYKGKRRSILGYVVALANEGGGMLVFGVQEDDPCVAVGSKVAEGKEGVLQQNIYRDLKIRVRTEVLRDGQGKRVLILHIPSRPIGRPLYFDDVALMRVGDRLERMSEERFIQIIQEQEPDFSATICPNLRIEDLDIEAVKLLQKRYANKQNNPGFQALAPSQALSDLGLSQGKQLTYAALILLGKRETLHQHLPQSKTILEFRNVVGQISYDWREEIDLPLILGIDQIWEAIHARNSVYPIRQGPYITEIKVFNEEVIREAILNAVTHRDYSLTSETVVKLFPYRIEVYNPGGFPKGVSLENLISVSSTPRSRLMADVLLKTGLVERSGQGVDKIFATSLLEGKSEPDYSDSDFYQVALKLDCAVEDPAFHLFLQQYTKADSEPLGVWDILTLAKIRAGYFQGLKEETLAKLESFGLTKRMGSGNSKRFVLGKLYQDLMESGNQIGNYTVPELQTIAETVLAGSEIRMGEIAAAFEGKLNRSQVRYLVDKLVGDGVLVRIGKGSGTKYTLSSSLAQEEDLLVAIFKLLNQS